MAKHRFKNVLYHYTTCESLFGMLQGYSEDNPNFTMWATHYAFMNDSSEYEFGKRVCKEAMQIYENRNGITGDKSFFNNLPSESTELWTNNEPYIISFSEDDSNAAMWSMYADGGKGVAIILERESNIFKSMEYKTPSYRIPSKCYYCEKSTDLIDDDHIPLLHRIFEIRRNDLDSQNTIHPIDVYLRMPPIVKHKAFEYEKEYRMVLMNQRLEYNVKHRTRNGVIIPYIEEKIPSSRIKGIIVGPRADFEQVKLSLQMFFKGKGGDLIRLCDEIYQSDIPFRG